MRATLLIALLLGVGAHLEAADLLRLVAQMPMPKVSGRIDHFAHDIPGKRLFVAALGNDTVEVFDLAQGKLLHSILDLKEPQGLAYVSNSNRLVIAEGGGAIDGIDGTTYARTHRLAAEDADNIRVDNATGLLYVGSGSGASSAIVVIDPKTMIEQRRIALPGHPEAFALEAHGPLIYVNVPTDRAIVIVDRVSGAPVARWEVTAARSNYPMALDEEHHRLLVGCRSPAKLLIYDTRNGALVGSLACAGDVDDVIIDATAKRIYVIGGEGVVTVVDNADPDHPSLLGVVETARGARTALFDAMNGRLYVACPLQSSSAAEIRVYERVP